MTQLHGKQYSASQARAHWVLRLIEWQDVIVLAAVAIGFGFGFVVGLAAAGVLR